jgi:hypothetical protein
MNLKSQILIIFILLQKTLSSDLCSSKLNTECLKPISSKPISFNVPIFQGRCCLNEGNTCEYVEEPSLGKIISNNYKCGTRLEACLYHTMTNSLNKEECTLYSIEMPYRCCYIKYKNQGRCFPIDTSRNKNIYSTKYHIKAIFGYFDHGDVQIDCYGKFVFINFWVLGFLVLGLF